MFGKHFGQVGVLTLLTVITFASVDYQKAFFADPVVAYANQTAAVVAPVVNQSPVVVAEDTAVACPAGYVCTPNPKVLISSVVMNGPNPQVVSYRFNLAGVDRLEVYLSANGSNNPIQNFSAIIHGTKSNNALGKTVLNTKGHSIAEFLVDFSNKTGKDVTVGMKAIGYSKNKLVGADGDVVTIFANPTKPFCPMGYTCERIDQDTSAIKITHPSNGQELQVGMQYKIIWNVNTNILGKDYLFDVTHIGSSGKELLEGISASNCMSSDEVKGQLICVTGWIPQMSSNNSKIVISAKGTNYIAYSGIFTIVNKPLITLLSPNGGELLKDGDKFTIKWNTKELPANSKISLDIFNGPEARIDYPNSNIAVVSANTNFFEWIVKGNQGWGVGLLPKNNLAAISKVATTSTGYAGYFIAIRVIDINGKEIAFDASDKSFIISGLTK